MLQGMEVVDATTDTLSMKEKLELFKKQKKNDTKKENVKPSVPAAAVAAKVSINKSSKSVSTTSTVESKTVASSKATASNKVLAPAATTAKPTTSTSATATITTKAMGKRRNPTAAEIKAKMDEYVMLAQTAGIEVGRSFMEAVPTEENMKGIETHAIYWLTWTRIEAEAKEWSQLEALFVRARVLVTSASGLQALNTAEKQFQTVLELHQKSTINVVPSRSSTVHAAAGITQSAVDGISAKKRTTSTSNRRDSGVSEITDSTARSATLGSSSSTEDHCLVNWMGEDGLSTGELAPPKALRFSLGGEGTIEGVAKNDCVLHSVPGVCSEGSDIRSGLRSTTGNTTTNAAAGKIVAMVLPKERRNVIKPMGRCGGVFEHVNVAATMQVYENASASVAAEAETCRSGTNTVAANIARLNGLSLLRGTKAPTSLSGALSGAVALPGLSHAPNPVTASSSASATMDVEQQTVQNGGDVGASLDMLLGLVADESMIEEESTGQININNNNTSSSKSNNNNDNDNIENTATMTTTSSITDPDTTRTTKGNHQTNHSAKRTNSRQPRRRVQLGTSDIFSDDDDDGAAVLPGLASGFVSTHSTSSSTVSNTDHNHTAAVGKRGRMIHEDQVQEATTSTSKKLRSDPVKPSAPVPIQPIKTTAKGTKKVSMVSFSECPMVSSSSHMDEVDEAVEDRRSSFGIESMTNAFHCTTLASGGRMSGRTRTSSGGGSGGRILRSGSKKLHRKGTPYAAADRPRFRRPATLSESEMTESDNMEGLMDMEPGLGNDVYGENRVRYGGRRGSESGDKRSSSGGGSFGSSGGDSGGSNEEIYGSYLTHVVSSVDIEMNESQFDLLATTPPASAMAVRRSRRLSHASSSAVKEKE